jgi:hypothetical protein
VTGTVHAELPDINDLVDVMLDLRTEPLASVITAVSEDTILLGNPIDRSGRIVLPEVGEGGLLIWGGGSNLRQAPLAVLETARRPDPTFLVRLTATPGPCQRRSFVRSEANVPVIVRLPDAEIEAVTIDLSEGGLRCNTPLDVDVRIKDSVVAEFHAGRPFTVPATVARIRRGNKDRPTELGLSFTGLSMAEADKIRRYVFSQLLEQRRRGAS